ncbi:MAG: DUF4062 domain-containing protein [Desulfobulbus sp.]|uniref:Fic family protein n=1 Tax=Desulfobulbus sp. TaxID=895 RepID=UPI00284727FE|nr:DUF4062 domain-containing protein [Desulfobulbus sp.]MDR2550152.1 DUF4062 domain-containing protein [Desulfobulbus sp.]
MSKSLIFLSSVQKELAAERRAVKDFIDNNPLLSRFFTVFLFETLPASGRRADEIYLQEVDHCVLYIGLLGNSYGFEDSEGISPTEREFDRATATGKERLIFVFGSDDTARHPKMQQLVRKVGDQVVRRRVNSIPELTASIYASLVNFLERNGDIRTLPFDAAGCSRATLDDLSSEKMRWFLSRAKLQRNFALPETTAPADLLTHLNLLEGGTPSHAAILLFGKAPQRFLLSSEVKCAHFHGTELRKPIPSYHIYKGTVFELADQAMDFVMSKLDRMVGARERGPQAPVSYEIPQPVVAEALVNAIAHRDYTSNASVQVMLFADRLEIWNPGELRPPLSLASLTRPHPSIPTNPLIAEPLFLAHYIEKVGSGTLEMAELCKAAGLRPPEFRLDMGCFILTLWRPEKSGKAEAITTGQVDGQVTGQVTGEVSEQVRRLLAVCEGALSRQELQERLGLRHRDSFQHNYLQPALEAGLIEMTIPDKPNNSKQRYRLKITGQVTGQLSGQVTGEVTGQVRRLLAVCEGTLRRQELQERLGLRHRDSFQHHYLQPALEAGLIEMTIPDKPRSSKQQYRLTEKGRLLLAAPDSQERAQ